jgi:DNA-binding NarL/FixJ family response regulator
MALRILIADDSSIVREGIKSFLSSCPEKWVVCGEAVDGHETIKKARELKPDVVLLDLSIQPLSCAEVVKSLRDLPHSTTIVLTSQQEERVLRQMAESVAAPYFVAKAQLATGLPTILRSLEAAGGSS